jgi:hypothetical protein
MTPAQQAQELIEVFGSKKSALKCVQRIVLANPHSNPFNTDVYSTMDYWLKVQEEIKKG